MHEAVLLWGLEQQQTSTSAEFGCCCDASVLAGRTGVSLANGFKYLAKFSQIRIQIIVQAATEERALQYASVARIAHPILSDSSAEPFPAIEIPLSREGRHLVVARMPVSRRSKVRWSSDVLGLGLAVQVWTLLPSSESLLYTLLCFGAFAK